MAKDNKDPLTSFQRLTLSDEKGYVDFLVSAYADQPNRLRFKDRDEASKYWRWEYLDNPAAPKGDPFIWICKSGGKIIAQACFMPVKLKIGNGYYKGGWCQDLMVLPEFRNLGVGFLLIRHAVNEMSALADILMAAGTNSNSFAVLSALGFRETGRINRNVIVTDHRKLSDALTQNSLLSSLLALVSSSLFAVKAFLSKPVKTGAIEIAVAGEFGKEFDGFFEDVSKKYRCITNRDSAELRWRFTDNSRWKYSMLLAKEDGIMLGYLVFREGLLGGKLETVRAGVISDILFDPEDAAAGRALLAYAVERFRGRVDIIRCDLLSKRAEKAVRSSGFINAGSSNRFLVYPIREELKRDPGLLTANNWYLTYGDSDLDLY